MNLAEVLAEMQKVLPSADISRVVAALRQDALIWDTLQEDDIFREAVARCGKNAEQWCPANLALIAVGQSLKVKVPKAGEQVALSEDIRQQAQRMYDQMLHSRQLPVTLAEAGLSAIALQERRMVAASWEGLFDELLADRGGGLQLSIWQTPLACLFGMVEDYGDMLWNLLSGQVTQSHLLLVSQVILSNPLGAQERLNTFLEVMDALSLSQQLTWLRLMNLQGHTELVIQLSDKLLTDAKAVESGVVREMQSDNDLNRIVGGALTLQQLAGLYQLSGQPEKAAQLLHRSKEAILYYMTGVHLQLLDVASQEGQMEEALAAIKKSIAALPEADSLYAEIALLFDHTDRAKRVQIPEMGKSDDPFIQLWQAARLAEKGDKSKAQALGRRAVAMLVERATKGQPLFQAQFLLNWQPISWVETLLGLDLMQEALQLALLFLQVRPADVELLELVSLILQKLGDNDQALGYVQVCAILKPDEPGLLRKIAELWEKHGDWKKSFEYRHRVGKLLQQPAVEDWVALARSAVGAERPRYAVEACAKVMEQQPNHLEAISLMGKALALLGRKDDAVQYLKKAISLAPSEKESWLVLADLQRKNGEVQQSLETLHLAVNAVPDCVEIHRQIAETWETLNDWHKSFDHRNHVVYLSPVPEDRDLLAYARSAYETKNYRQTLEACERVLQAKGEDGMAKSMMGWALYQLGEFEKSALCVKEAIAIKPDIAENWILLTNLQEREGDTSGVLDTLQSAVEVLPQDVHIQRRLAEKLEQNENWVRAFVYRENVLRFSLSPQLLDVMAYACCALHVGQPEVTIRVCETVLDKDADNGMANSLAGQAFYQLGEDEKARHYLSRATLLAPDVADSWLLLSELYNRDGDDQRSLETLRAAVLAVPNSVKVNLALAEASIAAGLTSQALPFLRQAAKLAPESAEVSLRLGRALFSLKQYDEARLSLEQAVQKWPQDADLALTYARIMLALGKTDEALPGLELVVQGGNADFDVLIMYVKALLGDKNVFLCDTPCPDFSRLVNARYALEKARQIKPEDFETSLLYAEVLAAQSEGQLAFECYQQLVDHPLAGSAEWHWRVMGGLGKVALQQQEVETALAVLKEAVQSRPENVLLQRLLAEALLLAQLRDEAMQTARTILKLASNDIHVLLWFADIASKLEEDGEAIEALTCVTELDATNAENWLLLAEACVRTGNEDETRRALSSLLKFEQLSGTHWRRVAYVFLALNDRASALSSLGQALVQEDSQSVDFLFELSSLQAAMGDHEAALYSVQQAIALAPSDAVLQVFEADLLLKLDRPQAAQACLERALAILDTGFAVAPRDHFYMLIKTGLMAEQWLETVRSKSGIHIRIAHLLRMGGNHSSALYHAQKAAEFLPDNLVCRFFAFDVALALLQGDGVLQPLAVLEGEAQQIDAERDRTPHAWMSLLCARAELALEKGDETTVAELVRKGLEFAPDAARLQAIQARLLIRQGQLKTAEEIYSKLAELVAGHEAFQAEAVSDFFGDELVLYWQQENYLWLAQVAFDLCLWDQALRFFELTLARHADNGYVMLQYAKALVMGAEKQRLFDEVDCVSHAPGQESLSKETFAKLEKALASAWQVSNSREVKRWHARGHLAFDLTPQSIEGLDKLSDVLDDKAAIVAALRQLKNPKLALELALRLPEKADYLIQRALCYQGNGAEVGLEYARQAVEDCPADPIYNAVAALLAREAGLTEQALGALETALRSWGNEPEWHAIAARLALEIGMAEESLYHWKQAFSLQPTKVEYALALGEAYLEQNDYSKAIQVLRNASQISADQVKIWFLLSEAYQRVGDLLEALECARMADQLDSTSSDAALLCGRICLQMKDYQTAYRYAQEGLKRQPELQEAWLLMCHILQDQGKLQEALDVLDSMPQEHQLSKPVFYERVRLTRQRYDAQTALPLAQKLEELYPNRSDVLGLLAMVLADCGEFADAERAALAALRLQPENPELNLLLGRLMRKSGQLDTAIHHLSQAIVQSPQMFEAYQELGATYQERRELLQALQVYEMGIKVLPDEPRLFYAAALVMREIKDYVGAEAMLRKASELSPDDLNIRRQLGAVIALNLVHNPQEANSYL